MIGKLGDVGTERCTMGKYSGCGVRRGIVWFTDRCIENACAIDTNARTNTTTSTQNNNQILIFISPFPYCGVILCRRGVISQGTEVIEVRLNSRILLELADAPLGDY
jgi:hypothetical protein